MFFLNYSQTFANDIRVNKNDKEILQIKQKSKEMEEYND
jgi:hypothetical protein